MEKRKLNQQRQPWRRIERNPVANIIDLVDKRNERPKTAGSFPVPQPQSSRPISSPGVRPNTSSKSSTNSHIPITPFPRQLRKHDPFGVNASLSSRLPTASFRSVNVVTRSYPTVVQSANTTIPMPLHTSVPSHSRATFGQDQQQVVHAKPLSQYEQHKANVRLPIAFQTAISE